MASRHAANASGEVLAAGGNSIAGSVQAGSAIVAVPVWMGGAVVTGAGALSQAVGEGTAKAGTATLRGSDKLWDFGSGDPAERPALDRARGLPAGPVPPPSTEKATDPSPAQAMKRL